MRKKFFKAILIVATIFAFFSAIPIAFCILCKKMRFDFSEDIDFYPETEDYEPIIADYYERIVKK